MTAVTTQKRCTMLRGRHVVYDSDNKNNNNNKTPVNGAIDHVEQQVVVVRQQDPGRYASPSSISSPRSVVGRYPHGNNNGSNKNDGNGLSSSKSTSVRSSDRLTKSLPPPRPQQQQTQWHHRPSLNSRKEVKRHYQHQGSQKTENVKYSTSSSPKIMSHSNGNVVGFPDILESTNHESTSSSFTKDGGKSTSSTESFSPSAAIPEDPPDRQDELQILRFAAKEASKENYELRVDLGQAHSMIEEMSKELDDAKQQILYLTDLVSQNRRAQLLSNHHQRQKKVQQPQQQAELQPLLGRIVEEEDDDDTNSANSLVEASTSRTKANVTLPFLPIDDELKKKDVGHTTSDAFQEEDEQQEMVDGDMSRTSTTVSTSSQIQQRPYDETDGDQSSSYKAFHELNQVLDDAFTEFEVSKHNKNPQRRSVLVATHHEDDEVPVDGLTVERMKTTASKTEKNDVQDLPFVGKDDRAYHSRDSGDCEVDSISQHRDGENNEDDDIISKGDSVDSGQQEEEPAYDELISEPGSQSRGGEVEDSSVTDADMATETSGSLTAVQPYTDLRKLLPSQKEKDDGERGGSLSESSTIPTAEDTVSLLKPPDHDKKNDEPSQDDDNNHQSLSKRVTFSTDEQEYLYIEDENDDVAAYVPESLRNFLYDAEMQIANVLDDALMGRGCCNASSQERETYPGYPLGYSHDESEDIDDDWSRRDDVPTLPTSPTNSTSSRHSDHRQPPSPAVEKTDYTTVETNAQEPSDRERRGETKQKKHDGSDTEEWQDFAASSNFFSQSDSMIERSGISKNDDIMNEDSLHRILGPNSGIVTRKPDHDTNRETTAALAHDQHANINSSQPTQSGEKKHVHFASGTTSSTSRRKLRPVVYSRYEDIGNDEDDPLQRIYGKEETKIMRASLQKLRSNSVLEGRGTKNWGKRPGLFRKVLDRVRNNGGSGSRR